MNESQLRQQNKKLLEALKIFIGCPEWRSFVHDVDCTDTHCHEDHPKDRSCTCDGPYNVEVIESVLKKETIEEEQKREERELVKMAGASAQRVLDNEDARQARQQIKSAIEEGNVQSDGDMTLVSQPDGPM